MVMNIEEVDTEPWGWSVFFDSIKSFLRDLRRKFGLCNLRYVEYALERLDICLGSVSLVIDVFNEALGTTEHGEEDSSELQILLFYRGQLEELVLCLQQIAVEWQSLKDTLDANELSPDTYRVTAVPTGSRGRPRFQITQEQLEYLHSLSFSWSDISDMLGVSRMTIYRYRRDFNMVSETRQTLSDHQLRVIITELRSEVPTIGETMVMGHLRAHGYSVTRERMRQAIHATDPINTSLRWRGNLSHRRPYSVPGPNSLWHLGKYS